MRLIYLALLAFLLSTSAYAQPAAPPISAKLHSPYEGVNDETKIRLGLEIKLPEGWHTYWRTPGVAGLPPNMEFTKQENVRAYEFQWPAPVRMVSQGLETYGYSGDLYLPVLVTLMEPGKPVALEGKVNIIMCDEICVPATAPISITVPKGPRNPTAAFKQWEAANQTVPALPDSVTLQQLWLEDDRLVALLNHPAAMKFSDMIVETPNSAIVRKASIEETATGSKFIGQFEDTNEAKAVDGRLVVLTFLPDDKTTPAVELRNDIGYNAADPRPVPGLDVPVEEPDTGPSLISILLFALLGGLILNLMPCVLPVLSLKLLTIVSHAGETRQRIRAGFMASALGILVSFWLLAGVMVALKQTGMALGWGIQFQQPAFLIFMIVIVLLFALNMFGLFEFAMPRTLQNKLGGPDTGHHSYVKEFFTGVFATLLATPCTAPFVGTAVGFALAASGGTIFAVFTALGLGLALPYILIALFPAIAQHMPRPGAWMRTLRTVLAIALLATAAWLGWVLYNQLNPPTPAYDPEAKLEWQEFSPAAIPSLIDQGRTVVVDITADWCLTCKVNERLVLNSDAVVAALNEPQVVRMKGDWTTPNDQIQQYLMQFKRAGIPFNIVFGPKAPEGIVLPELLSQSAMLDALDRSQRVK